MDTSFWPLIYTILFYNGMHCAHLILWFSGLENTSLAIWISHGQEFNLSQEQEPVRVSLPNDWWLAKYVALLFLNPGAHVVLFLLKSAKYSGETLFFSCHWWGDHWGEGVYVRRLRYLGLQLLFTVQSYLFNELLQPTYGTCCPNTSNKATEYSGKDGGSSFSPLSGGMSWYYRLEILSFFLFAGSTDCTMSTVFSKSDSLKTQFGIPWRLNWWQVA